jgi:hypothetical protein
MLATGGRGHLKKISGYTKKFSGYMTFFPEMKKFSGNNIDSSFQKKKCNLAWPPSMGPPRFLRPCFLVREKIFKRKYDGSL